MSCDAMRWSGLGCGAKRAGRAQKPSEAYADALLSVRPTDYWLLTTDY